jgi:integrase
MARGHPVPALPVGPALVRPRDQACLAEVTARLVDDFIDQRLAEGAKRYSIQKELTTIRAMLKVAKRRGEFPGDIEAVMPDGFDAGYEPRTGSLTPEEMTKLLAELLPDRAARAAFIVAIGPRWRETARARREDVDLERGIVFLRGTKTANAKRTLPVVGWGVPLLEHAVRYGEGEGGQLFRPWSNVRRDLAEACARAHRARLPQ